MCTHTDVLIQKVGLCEAKVKVRGYCIPSQKMHINSLREQRVLLWHHFLYWTSGDWWWDIQFELNEIIIQFHRPSLSSTFIVMDYLWLWLDVLWVAAYETKALHRQRQRADQEWHEHARGILKNTGCMLMPTRWCLAGTTAVMFTSLLSKRLQISTQT